MGTHYLLRIKQFTFPVSEILTFNFLHFKHKKKKQNLVIAVKWFRCIGYKNKTNAFGRRQISSLLCRQAQQAKVFHYALNSGIYGDCYPQCDQSRLGFGFVNSNMLK